jgi:hypothetical protein
MPMKTINRQRYHEVLPVKTAVENDILRIPGVTGVDVGYKEVDGAQTDEMAVLVFVRQKGVFDEADRIPALVQGISTDVIECEFLPLSVGALPAALGVDSKRYDPVVGGCSVAPARNRRVYGTLGVLVRDNTNGTEGYLSNWHVFCGSPDWSDPAMDHRMVQPAIALGGNVATDVIGSVYSAKLGQISRPFAYDWYVDCAVCSVSKARPASRSILRIGPLSGSAEPIEGELVRKYGAKSEFTYGVVQSTNCSINVPYSGVGNVTFYYQYRITAPNASMPPFSEAGDSGSLVVDTEYRAVGLNFAGGKSGQVTHSVANPMYMVLGALNLSLITS